MEAYVYILLFFGIFISIEIFSVLKYLSQHMPRIKRVKITFRINLIILFSGFAMLAVVILFDINYLKYEFPVPFSNWKQINFTDFRGLKRPGQTLDGNSEFAFVVTETVVKKSSNAIDVTAYFHPARSYVFNSNAEDDKLLLHEMYHFHITEYCARMLRKQFSLLKKAPTAAEIDLQKEIMQAVEDSMQYNYDDETYHSYVLGKQLAWEHKIDSCMETLKAFANTSVRIGSNN